MSGRREEHDGREHDGLDDVAEPSWQPIDLLLRQGSDDQLAGMRQEIAEDPMRALELAETVETIEQFRQLRTEASPSFAGKLQSVAIKADRYCRAHYEPRRPWWQMPLVTVTAAAATFLLLWSLEAERLWSKRPACAFDEVTIAAGEAAGAAQPGDALLPGEAVPVVHELAEALWDEAVATIHRRLEMESTDHLQSAFRDGLQHEGDSLRRWLDPKNALVLARLDHELRTNTQLRTQALLRRGALPEIDDRVQKVAGRIADELLQWHLDERTIDEVAVGMRSLIAAGGTATRTAALERAGDWLAAQLPRLHGGQLVLALSGLIELAAIRGDHFDLVAEHGQRLVAEVLQPDLETWLRRRPELLNGRLPASTVGEAGRLLARLPAFGVDGWRCGIVRQLVLGQLRERRSVGQERPEILAAMLYGCGDLLSSEQGERDRLVWILRRWKPARLAPDYATVQQIAWSLEPGSRGFTRLQRELRQLAVQPIPEQLAARARFCMCLATNYAGFAGTLLAIEHASRDS